MSFEGYNQAICQIGHYYTYDVYDVGNCPVCNAEAKWTNQVDQTNGDEYGVIPLESLNKFMEDSGEIETCPNCNHHTIKHYPIYRIPTEEERQSMRHAYHWKDTMQKNGLIPCSILEAEFKEMYNSDE